MVVPSIDPSRLGLRLPVPYARLPVNIHTLFAVIVGYALMLQLSGSLCRIYVI
jgi:hypothetical protein